ncbi:amidase signature domain-containing protein [Podospora fimiseda]|uniref:Amidase signature domain-containing protein n=1 Tax=Podospora fimiseda TaxID=252190 RepID=A0AAN6YTJ0_9PEZI|nr:amidase signature domain-containing protein [Podospora fimiseda]
MQTSPIYEIHGDRFITGEPTTNVPFPDAPERVTVFHLKDTGHFVNKTWVDRILGEYEQDNVFRDSFLQGVIIVGNQSGSLDITVRARNALEARGAAWIKAAKRKKNSNFTLASGSHLVSNGILAPVLKLYDDTHGAFLHSLRRGPEDKFVETGYAGCHTLRTLSIAVPSRAGVAPTSDLSLHGYRIAVKDIFELENVRTSVCNRAYYELYDPPTKTAACIEVLVKAGAAIVGTTKLASFAATEEPVECIDYAAPWNPRADGYQSPAGSSSGSGAAMAAYEWLDITNGSDTSGSGRRPGHWNGCIAMRPTHGLLPDAGYIPSFKEMGKCRYFADSCYGKVFNPPQRTLDLIDEFVNDLESSLGVTHEKVSFNELWNSTTPEAAKGLSLQEFMRDASRNSFFHDDYHSFDKFRADYFAKFGKQPYVSPPVRWQWDLSSKITTEERNEAVKRLKVYRKWFTEHVLQEGKRDTIVLIPIEEISPRYRDEPPSKHFNPVGVPMLFISPILGAPELTVPIGHSPFISKVSRNEEKLPIAISLLGSPGRDLELFDIVIECLRKSGRPMAVKSGKEMF